VTHAVGKERRLSYALILSTVVGDPRRSRVEDEQAADFACHGGFAVSVIPGEVENTI
jgi:hypothetical protein